jgi:predicted enzyme related to lactoylglutathione lyase
MMKRKDSPSTGPIVVIDVDSIDSTLARVGELGGSTVQGQETVGEMGFAAYVKDPDGNVRGLGETAVPA